MTRCRRLACASFVLLLAACGAAAADPPPRLRPIDRDMARLLDRGLDASPSLRAIADRLNASDVVVYLECARLPEGLDGQLTFVSAGGGLRYVIVRVAWDRSRGRRTAMLAHELQHAVEVADHPEIVDQRTLALSYARFGFERRLLAGPRTAAYDTHAAIDTGARVLAEVQGANGE